MDVSGLWWLPGSKRVQSLSDVCLNRAWNGGTHLTPGRIETIVREHTDRSIHKRDGRDFLSRVHVRVC